MSVEFSKKYTSRNIYLYQSLAYKYTHFYRETVFFLLSALHAPLIALSLFIRAHGADLSIGDSIVVRRNFVTEKELHWS